MNEEILNKLRERETRIVFLENKIKSIIEVLKAVNADNMEDARSLVQTLEKPESSILATLLKNVDPDTDQTYNFLKILIGSMPFPVFIKDHESKYTMINTYEASLLGLRESEIIGKRDRDFVEDADELDVIENSDFEVLVEKNSVELPNQRLSLANGSYVMKTHKIPFVNPITKKINILGISKDVTDEINLRQVLFNPYS